MANTCIANGQDLASRFTICRAIYVDVIVRFNTEHLQEWQIIKSGARCGPPGTSLPSRPSNTTVSSASRVWRHRQVPFDFVPGIVVWHRFFGSWWDNGRLASEIGEEMAIVIEDMLAYRVVN